MPEKPINAVSAWSGEPMPPPKLDYGAAFGEALIAEREYLDTHCSVFTPESFFRIFSQIQESGLLPLRLGELRPTQPNQLDFSVILHKA